MASAPTAGGDLRRFRVATSVWSVAVLGFAVLLLTPFADRAVQERAGAAGLIAAGVVATACGLWRARRERGAQVVPWVLLSMAGMVVVGGNGIAATAGSASVASPSLASDLGVGLGYLLSIPALLTFPGPGTRRAGTGLMIVLDGLVAGCSLLLVTSILVYPRLLDAPARESMFSQVVSFIFPGLDVVVATVAVLLVVRSDRHERLMLGLVAAGFLLWAAADLAFAAQVAAGTFAFGTLLNVGWVGGYLTLGLATFAPRISAHGRRSAPDQKPVLLSDVPGTALLFGLVVLAAVVQVGVPQDGALVRAQAAVWVVLIGAAGTRQVLLIRANQGLRRGLEQRVEEQVADLRRLARQNEALVTSVGDGVYGVDPHGRITFANPSAAAVLGYAPEQLVGAYAHELFHAPGPDGHPYPWEGCYIHDAILEGRMAHAEEDDYLAADGRVVPVELTAAPLIDEQVVQGAVVVFRDVTVRREVDRMKDEFLSIVSHELRTPLTSIRGSLGLLSSGHMGELAPAVGSLVSVARQSSERLVRLVDDLLDLERVGAGAEPLRLADLDARGVLETAVLQLEGLAHASQVELVVEPTASGALHADEDKVLQLLVNLTANAVKFSEAGGVVRLDSAPAEHGQTHLTVTDHGRGIPESKLETIFTRFEQVDSSDSREKGGAGLGLTISRAIVQQHGGRIWMASELGRGTVAHALMPSPGAGQAPSHRSPGSSQQPSGV